MRLGSRRKREPWSTSRADLHDRGTALGTAAGECKHGAVPSLRSLISTATVAASLASALVVIAGPAAEAAPMPVREALVRGADLRCPTSVPSGTLWDDSGRIGVSRLCRQAVTEAPTPQARTAIRAAFHMLGAPYACGDVGRVSRFRYDCSSLVSRAYATAGIPAAGPTWSSSTRDMVPWDGRRLAPWASYIEPASIKPGDLVLYSTGATLSRHVVMYLGNGYMLHTNYCGGVAHVERFWGFSTTGRHRFLVVRRVVVPPASAPKPRDLSTSSAARSTTVSFSSFTSHQADATVRVQRALNDVVAVGLLVDGRWDGGMQAAIVGFRRHVWGMTSAEANYPPDRATLRELGRRAGFALVD